MEDAIPCKEGYLLFPPHGVLGQLKKSWQKKYCQLFKSSKHGIERLEVFDSAEDVSKSASMRIITLENCVKIKQDAQKHQPNVFSIVTKTSDYQFAAITEKDMVDWVAAFQVIAFKDHCSRQSIEEDNDLYCTSSEESTQTNGIFTVQLVASEASNRCGLEPGPYTLVITSATLQLRDCKDHRHLASWPYCFIRRYGYREGKFTFEAGRKCSTGEGDFNLEHSHRQEIFRCISSKMKNMRKMLSGDTPPSSGILCGDTQFQAALSMEARSRSPLPPSPTSPNDVDYSTISQSSLKPISFMESQPFVSTGSVPVLKPLPKPAKPPRKHIRPVYHDRKPPEEPASAYGGYSGQTATDSTPGGGLDYDNVEIRTEAWKTHGVNEMMHTECVRGSSDTDDDSADYIDCAELPQVSIPKRPGGTKILLTQLSNKSDFSDSYDTLQHFGSSSKLNSNPGYKHISAPVTSVKPSAPTLPPPVSAELYPSYNDYEDVMENMQACRLADDSHLGYGMIRKKPLPSKRDTKISLGPSHQVYNDIEYAVVEKPKKI